MDAAVWAIIILTALLIAVFLLVVFFFYCMAFHRGFEFRFPPPKENEAYLRKLRMKEEMRAWLESQPQEKWTAFAADGKRLNAVYVPFGDGKKAVLCIHGWHGDHTELSGQARFLQEAGYGALLPDLYAHGESEGKLIGFGWPDKEYILQWIDRLIEAGVTEIGICGVSMGAATAMMTIGETGRLPEQVKWAAEDCGYSSVYDQMISTAGTFMKKVPFLIKPVVNTASLWCRITRGFSFRDASAEAQLRKCRIPLLMIHGTADTFVPYFMLDRNEAAVSSPHRVLRTEGTPHAASMYEYYDLYKDTFLKFVRDAENKEDM